MDQIVQVAAALLILLAFAGLQTNRMGPHSLRYLILNLVGSAALAVLAAIASQWGFLLLESVWAGVTAWALLARQRERRRARPGRA